MDKKNILSELQTIFQSVFHNEKLLITPYTTQGDIDLWDSLNHAVLIDAIEKKYSIKFDLMDMISMQNVGDICEKVITRTAS